jgi:hypothetical protein
VPEAADLWPLSSGANRAATIARLAPLNTRHLFSLLRQHDVAGRVNAANAWANELRGLMYRHGPTSLGLLSLAMADAHTLAISSANEPIDIGRETALASLYRVPGPAVVAR